MKDRVPVRAEWLDMPTGWGKGFSARWIAGGYGHTRPDRPGSTHDIMGSTNGKRVVAEFKRFRDLRAESTAGDMFSKVRVALGMNRRGRQDVADRMLQLSLNYSQWIARSDAPLTGLLPPPQPHQVQAGESTFALEGAMM